MDINFTRLKKVRDTARRLASGEGLFVVADGRHIPFKKVFTKILIDAPCSGFGVISKHPDIKWRREIRDIFEFSGLQKQILEQAKDLLKDGGLLVYSTCTIDPAENEQVIQTFYKNHETKFSILPVPERFKKFSDGQFITTIPSRHHTDGSFSAVLQKKPQST